MTLSVTLICKNEEENLHRLLPTLTFADEIIVVDTGSTDDTVSAARKYTDKVYYYKWRDDFSAARNYAISRAVGDYVMWLDADDEVPQLTIDVISRLKNTSGFADTCYLRYRMGHAADFWFWRERILRRSNNCRFKGFIHEAIAPFGSAQYLDCEIVHTSAADHSARNLSIYRNALKRGKRFSLRDKYYYARTLMESGYSEEAIPILTSFCKNPRALPVDRAQGYKILARESMKYDVNKAVSYLCKSLAVLPPDAEACCLFGDAYLYQRRYDCAANWYEYALASTCQYGFVNGYYKAFYPYIQLSVCYWNTGRMDKAKLCHLRAKALQPTNPAVLNNEMWFN